MTMNLGRLERVPLREVWTSESGDFTPWLAEEANLALLGDALNLELELEAQEKGVGPFRADLLCKDTRTDSWVLIENQLERTDHSHLGQLLTYAAGLEAVTIVWIAERFTDEHRAALDWLNAITGEHIDFFGIEVELWRIGDSPRAPKFSLVSKPNGWTKHVASIRRSAETEGLSETKQLQREYWSALNEALRQRSSFIRPQQPPANSWTRFAIGRSGMHLTAFVNMRERYVGVELILRRPEADPHFTSLCDEKEQIETDMGETLEWKELGSSFRIVLQKDDVQVSDTTDWPRQHAWFTETLERFHRTFSPRLKRTGLSARPAGQSPDGELRRDS